MFSDVCAVVCGWELGPDGSNLKAAQRENTGHHWVLQPPVPRVPRTCSQTDPNLPQILSPHEEGWLRGMETWAFAHADKQKHTSAIILCAISIPQIIQNVSHIKTYRCLCYTPFYSILLPSCGLCPGTEPDLTHEIHDLKVCEIGERSKCVVLSYDWEKHDWESLLLKNRFNVFPSHILFSAFHRN